jgi:hypothetical protein
MLAFLLLLFLRLLTHASIIRVGMSAKKKKWILRRKNAAAPALERWKMRAKQILPRARLCWISVTRLLD